MRPLGKATLLAALAAGGLCGAPKLRLVDTTVGPVSVAVGAGGATQTVEAYNAGDGNLALTLSSSASWINPSVGAARACRLRAGNCLPLQLALQTASLAKGVYTGIVTVSDPNAVDAPQTITVTVQMGGGVPDRLDFFVAPNGSSAESVGQSNSQIRGSVRTDSGGSWLAFSLLGAGSFSFVQPYRVTVTHQPGMAEGTYNGSLTISNSSLAAENKTVPVSMRVTSQPIAEIVPPRLSFRFAPGIPKQTGGVTVINRGLGTLSVSAVSVTTASGGNWLAAQAAGSSAVAVTVDTAVLTPGTYQGTVSLTSNAVNGPLSVPVELVVPDRAAPRLYYQGVVNNATFDPEQPVAKGGVVALRGEQFTYGEPRQNSSLPLPAELGGTRALVNNQPAPLYYSSYGQVNIQVPYETPEGEAVVRVERDGQRSNPVAVTVASVAPRILRLGIGDYGIVVNQDGTFPMRPTAGIASRPARPGEALVIYAIDLGPTVPAATSGAAAPSAEPLARVVPTPVVLFGGGLFGGGVPVDALFAGLTPGFVGLYQINVVVPEEAPRGENVALTLAVGAAGSNRVTIAIE